MPPRIPCQIHDYFEAACVRNYTLDVEIYSAQRITAKAVDIRYDKDKNEYLVLATLGRQKFIKLTDIRSVSVLDSDADFSEIPINDL
ncbi:Rho-binding antiterminator [Alteromonas sp. ASW11-36]|uniref:Rho-binding antiterminator n=1 Tax=Alteromonas arenosi TaxID=3055817 RepID=A0ABT7T0X2_9ALTE|nr:Rho-binding antiterminator [Alteromonas sp. ASW11-36]MDM7862087.1 Rho-binding antiterminator [Alteromonas sp. ASW11-36]